MTKKIKKQINEMNYESMLRLWRFALLGHPMFQDETGDYYSKVMKQKANDISNAERVAASKAVGWE